MNDDEWWKCVMDGCLRVVGIIELGRLNRGFQTTPFDNVVF